MAAANPQSICKWRLEGANHLEVRIEDHGKQGIVGTVFNTETRTSWPNSIRFEGAARVGALYFNQCIWKGNGLNSKSTEVRLFDDFSGLTFVAVDFKMQRIYGRTCRNSEHKWESYREVPFFSKSDLVLANNANQAIKAATEDQTIEEMSSLAETGMIRNHGDTEGEIVKIWPNVRADGTMVQLIRSGDNLKSHLIVPLATTIEDEIPLPLGMTVDDAIAHLIRLECIAEDDNTVRFDFGRQDPESSVEEAFQEKTNLKLPLGQKEKIHLTWDLKDGTTKVHIISIGNDKPLVKVVRSDREPEYYPSDHPEGTPIEKTLLLLDQQIPTMDPDGTIAFSKIECIQSAMDPKCIIDKDHWAITLVNNTSRSAGSVPKNWGGHAVIIIETIDFENGGYQKWKADALGKKSDGKLLRVRFDQQLGSDLQDDKNFYGNQTWIRARNVVEKMMNRIFSEKERFDRGENIGKFSALVGLGSSRKNVYNCIEWARKRLLIADVEVKTSYGDNLLITPASISGTLLGTAQKVTTTTVLGGGALLVGMGVGGFLGLICGGPLGLVIGGMMGGGLTSLGASAAKGPSIHLEERLELERENAE